MAAISVHLDIVSPESQIFSGLVEVVSVVGALGELGILPGHTPLLSSIKPGIVRVTLQGGEKKAFYVSGGLIEVQPSSITILADTVIRTDSLDEAQAVLAQERAAKLQTEKKSNLDYNKTFYELVHAAAQVRAVQESRQRRR